MKESAVLNFKYSVVSALSLKPLLASLYKLPFNVEVVYLYQGINDTYQVITPKRQYVLRIYRHNWKSVADIEGEVELLRLLDEHQIPVSYPIPNADGNYVISLDCPEGIRYAVLFSYATGEKIQNLTAEGAKLFGQHLGVMHQLTKNRSIEKLSRQYTVPAIFEFSQKILDKRLKGTTGSDKIHQIAREFEKKISADQLNQLPQGICHGDPHHENAFLDKASEKMTLFDFDFCGNGYLHYDLGSFYKYERDNELNKLKFLEGYEQILPLKKEERDLIPYFEVLMRIFHLGARAKNADGIKNPLWPIDEIEKTINDIDQQLSKI